MHEDFRCPNEDKVSDCDTFPRNYTPGEPSPVGKAYLTLSAEYRAQTGLGYVPKEVQDENWDIAYHPTEKVQVLSRKGNPIGLSKKVARTPSWKK